MTARDLLAMLEALPPTTMLSASWFAEQLAAIIPALEADHDVYDVAGLAQRWHRSASAVRALIEAGALADAWKQGGRAWRVPRASVLAYESEQAAQVPPQSHDRSAPRGLPPDDPHGLRAAAGVRRRGL